MKPNLTAARQSRHLVTIVVPCYNEARRLNRVQFEEFLGQSTIANFVFVDDGSKDATFELLKGMEAGREQRVTVLRSPRNQGKAEAVRLGVNHVLEGGAAYVGYWDADLATPLSAIEQFLTVMEGDQGLDMIFGSRVKLLGRTIERRKSRHYLGRIFATVVSAVLRVPIYDTQCGAKIFRVRSYTKTLFRDRFLSRWVFDVEIIARYIRETGSPGEAAKKIYEFPLYSWLDIGGSKVRPFDFVIALIDVIRIHLVYSRHSGTSG